MPPSIASPDSTIEGIFHQTQPLFIVIELVALYFVFRLARGLKLLLWMPPRPEIHPVIDENGILPELYLETVALLHELNLIPLGSIDLKYLPYRTA